MSNEALDQNVTKTDGHRNLYWPLALKKIYAADFENV